MSLNRSPERPPGPLKRIARLAARACAAFALLALAMPAGHAQAGASASVSIASEYSSRGMSLSQGRPAPQLRLDIDGNGGWYAGTLVSRAALPYSDARLQVLAYGGYAHNLAPGLSWEAGALEATFLRGEQYRYHEFYAGVARDRIAARLSFSPAYYGGGKTVYAELNGSYPLGGRVTLIGHAGVLHPLGRAGDDDTRNRIDLRLALDLDLGDCMVQLALLGALPRRDGHDAARALALSATYAF